MPNHIHIHRPWARCLPAFNFTTMLLILITACLPLTSCFFTITDPEYKSLAAQVASNPNKNDIVGTWHQQHDPTDPILMNMQTNRSLMFRSDGSGEWYRNLKGLIPFNAEKKGSLQWNYAGAGLWTTNKMFGGWNHKFQITQNKKGLLMEMKDQDGTVQAVFRRE